MPVEGTRDKFVVGVGFDVALLTWNSREVVFKPLCEFMGPNLIATNDAKVDPAGRCELDDA